MISEEVLLTIFNYLANGVVSVESSSTNAITTLAPYQIIAIIKNNNVAVSRTTITSINVSDIIALKGAPAALKPYEHHVVWEPEGVRPQVDLLVPWA